VAVTRPVKAPPSGGLSAGLDRPSLFVPTIGNGSGAVEGDAQSDDRVTSKSRGWHFARPVERRVLRPGWRWGWRSS